MTAPLTYSIDDMLVLFQLRSREGLAKYLAGLEAHGFPTRLPHVLGQSAKWSRPAVDTWMMNWGSATTAPPTPPPDFQTLRNKNEARYTSN